MADVGVHSVVLHAEKPGRGVVHAIAEVDGEMRAAVVWDTRLPSWPLLSDLRRFAPAREAEEEAPSTPNPIPWRRSE